MTIENLTEGEFGYFGATVNLKAWNNFLNGPKEIDIIFVNSEGDTIKNIMQKFSSTYGYIIKNQNSIQRDMLDFLLNEYPYQREDYRDFLGSNFKKLMPSINHIDEFSNLIGLSTIYFRPEIKDGIAYVGYQFYCAWDEEHGLGFITHKDETLDMGGATSAFNF
ncbi:MULTISPECIES: DUF6985 domain-containing protein [unclassified Aureispira]|uniref:DUF6985 domain-containing protein n=1 Tax=unclassified Aureispira TaxID=2649989 RepID=UPI0006978907|nr:MULTISPECIES: hypothetical protein [unclassified Aureispira]WMX13213.1 hypothetical protein QP953_20425 [Aureispira sp. CCB-E]